MKIYKYVGAVYCCLLLLSCGRATHNISTISDGGSHTGGSNTIDDKPIEGTILNFKEPNAYNPILSQLLKEVDLFSPGFAESLRNSLYFTRTWYLVPGPLIKLPNQRIAIPSEVKTQQFALHTAQSIWIDANLYWQNTSDRRYLAQHFVHEMVMSLRVDENLKHHKEFLSDLDYEEIRAVTNYLFHLTTREDFYKFLIANHFLSKSTVDEVKAIQNWMSPLDLSSPENIFDYMSKIEKTKLPEIFKEHLSERGHCAYSFDETNKLITINSVYNPGYDNLKAQSISIHFTDVVHYEKDMLNNKIEIQALDLSKEHTVNEEHLFVGITIQNGSISRLKVHRAKYSDVWDYAFKDFIVDCSGDINAL